jgi:glycosyltransferase involved in cell wall biosynthesis
MRVGLVVYGDLATVSGGYLYDRQLVEHLRKRGDQVLVFSQEPRNYAGNLFDNASSELITSIAESRLDVLLQDELNHPSLIIPNRRLRKRLNLPIVSIVHHLRSSEDHSRWQSAAVRQFERWYLRSVDGYIFNSETTKMSVKRLVGRSDPCVVAVPAGNRFSSDLTDEELHVRATRGDPLHIVFLGNVISRKGLHTLLDALASLPFADWNLSVLGRLDVDERYTDEIKRRIRATRLTEHVVLYGSMPDREIARLLRSADLMAMPSTYEGYGIAYVEGMAFGLPAIATTSGAAMEIISHGENGWLINPGDSQEITRILTEFRENRALREEMSRNAYQRYLNHPGWSDSMEQIRSFLLTMTGVSL